MILLVFSLLTKISPVALAAAGVSVSTAPTRRGQKHIRLMITDVLSACRPGLLLPAYARSNARGKPPANGPQAGAVHACVHRRGLGDRRTCRPGAGGSCAPPRTSGQELLFQ